MCSAKDERIEETEDKPVELASTPYLVETIKQLQTEIENLQVELQKTKRVPSGKIGTLLLIPGVLSLIFSVLRNAPVLAFIGLSLTFWGVLFFFVTPIRFVQSDLLGSTATSSYSTMDRIIKDLKYEGKGYYIPPYPKGVYLPEHLKGLKDMIVFISADTDTTMPSMEELAESRFLLKNPKGICVVPPGLNLLAQFEKELETDISKLQLGGLCENLPHLIRDNFKLAKEIQMDLQEKEVQLRVYDSIYKKLYLGQENLKSVHLLGCPLVSALACAIAKATGKIVIIDKDRISPDAETIEVWYNII